MRIEEAAILTCLYALDEPVMTMADAVLQCVMVQQQTCNPDVLRAAFLALGR